MRRRAGCSGCPLRVGGSHVGTLIGRSKRVFHLERRPDGGGDAVRAAHRRTARRRERPAQGAAGGDHRRAHRAAQPPRLRRTAPRGDRTGSAWRPHPRPGDRRLRRPEANQRPARPRAGRRCPAGDRQGDPRVQARPGRRGTPRRRRVRHRAHRGRRLGRPRRRGTTAPRDDDTLRRGRGAVRELRLRRLPDSRHDGGGAHARGRPRALRGEAGRQEPAHRAWLERRVLWAADSLPRASELRRASDWKDRSRGREAPHAAVRARVPGHLRRAARDRDPDPRPAAVRQGAARCGQHRRRARRRRGQRRPRSSCSRSRDGSATASGGGR